MEKLCSVSGRETSQRRAGEDDERGGDRAIARGPVAALGYAGVRFASARFVGAASRRARARPARLGGLPRAFPRSAGSRPAALGPSRARPRAHLLPAPRPVRPRRTLRLRLRGPRDAENPTGKLLVACGVGLLTGLGVAVFNIAEHGLHDLVFLTTASSPERYQLEGVRDVRPDTWLQAVGTVAAPTAAGFAVTGLRFLADGFDGEEKPRWPWANEEERANEDASETPPDPTNVFRSAAKPTLKAAAAVVTLGSGASLGPEGPSVEIGASIAGGIAAAGTGTGTTGTRTGKGMSDLSPAASSRRLGLIAAGSAAGISAGFGAPIAGLFFAFESILQPAASKGNLEQGGSTGFGPLTTESVILASVLAAVVSAVLLGEQPAFVVPAFELKNLAELPLYLPLGLACGATAVAFRASSSVLGGGFTALERGVGGFGVPRELHAPFGGFAFGLASLLFPEVTYQGFDNVNSMLGAQGSAFRVPYPPTLLLELVVVKLLATSLCRQAGLVGGVYAPSLFMGAALGSAYGAALVPLALQGVPVAPPQAYALVGMAGVLAGICRVPLTAILLLFELTHDYRIIVPLMGTVGVASWVAGAAERSAESAKAAARGDSARPNTPVTPPWKSPRDDRRGSWAQASSPRTPARGRATTTTTPRPRPTPKPRRHPPPSRVFASRTRCEWTSRGYPPRRSAASAAEAARDAAKSARESGGGVAGGSAAVCCAAIVVDDVEGSFVGVATAASLAAAVERATRGGREETAAEACDPNVPTVTSSTTLLDASAAMRAHGASLAAVVAGVGVGGVDGVGGADGVGGVVDGGVGGVVDGGPGRGGRMYEPPVGRVGGARAVEAERDAAAIAKALRARARKPKPRDERRRERRRREGGKHSRTTSTGLPGLPGLGLPGLASIPVDF